MDEIEYSEAQDPVEMLQQRLGIRFQQQSLLVEALTHRSFLAEFDGSRSSERLEFLGDAVLDLIIAEDLFRNHPDWPEGELTKVKAALVNERSLEMIAKQWNIGMAVRISRGEDASGGRARRALLADTVEAVIAAYFLDQGLDACRDFVLREIAFILEAVEHQEHARDYKTLLQEAFQARYQTAPSYEVLRESGPPHDRTIEVAVVFNGQVLGQGKEKSKKAAEQRAAAEALLTFEAEGEQGE